MSNFAAIPQSHWLVLADDFYAHLQQDFAARMADEWRCPSRSRLAQAGQPGMALEP